MPRYIMLSTLGPDGASRLLGDPSRLKAVNEEVEALGVKVLDQYALLGQYDFCNILEAPDDRTMAKVALILSARGTIKSETHPAIPVDDYLRTIAPPLEL